MSPPIPRSIISLNREEGPPPSGDVEVFSTGTVGNSNNPQTINFDNPTVNSGGTVVLMSTCQGYSNAITSVSGGGTDWTQIVTNANSTPFRRAEIWMCTDMPAGVSTLTITRTSNSGAGSTVTELSPGAAVRDKAAFNTGFNTDSHPHADVDVTLSVDAGGVMMGCIRWNSTVTDSEPATIAGATTRTLQEGTLNLHELHELGSDVAAGERMISSIVAGANRQSGTAMISLTIGGV